MYTCEALNSRICKLIFGNENYFYISLTPTLKTINMKKITLVLFAMCNCALLSAQTTYNFAIPNNNGGTSEFRAPNGTQDHAYMWNIMYVHQYELLPMNLSTINSVSFQLTKGASIAVTGNFTVWMGNTTDAIYLKGTTLATALT